MSEERELPEAKRVKISDNRDADYLGQPGRIKGIAPIKREYLLGQDGDITTYNDEDEGGGIAERNGSTNAHANANGKRKARGQNKNRKFVQPRDLINFCEQVKMTGDPSQCQYGESCKFEHDLEKYIESKPKDLEGVCPVYEAIGYCPSGLKCRWLFTHYTNGRLTIVDELKELVAKTNYETNRVSVQDQNLLQRKKFDFKKADVFIKYLNELKEEQQEEDEEQQQQEEKKNNTATYIEPPLLPIEKRKTYLNRAKILSPLTTVGNLPYRRLMKDLGTDITYSEMALALPLLQGSKSEWALARAHSTEIGSFGVQIAASKPWQAVKAAEAVAQYAPDTAETNLNCGCPIDLIFRQGAGSALLDNPAKLLRMLKGMNAVSGDIPVSVKIRTGTRDKHLTAKKLVSRIINEGQVSAITLHGRSRAQRYARLADWDYIREVADIVKRERENNENENIVRPWIIGNGDVYSWKDWYDNIEQSGVDSVMVARGALIKPWIFEEIESRQYLDKTATERLEIIKKYAYYGLEHWGADEYGINMTRRYLCEFLSFTHRYVPVGILEYLPPKINDRPFPWKGRNELETLLASTDYKDWIKISEMFLGPAHEGFDFKPKHKSNSYE